MIRFGPGGNADSFYAAGRKSSIEAPAYLAGLGLNAYEYQSGRGVRIGQEFCQRFGAAAAANDIQLSLHAPYFINPGSADPKVWQSSRRHIFRSLEAAAAMGAPRIVLHPGSPGTGSRQQALARAAEFLTAVADDLLPAFPGITLCLETMGKVNQLGTLPEIIELCRLSERFMPVVDFGHLHARGQGAIAGRDDYERIFAAIAAGLGAQAVQNLHIHFSAIEYGRSGEIRHRTLAEKEFGPDFEPLAAIIARDGLTPVIISEAAGTQIEDALLMQEMVERYRIKKG